MTGAMPDFFSLSDLNMTHLYGEKNIHGRMPGFLVDIPAYGDGPCFLVAVNQVVIPGKLNISEVKSVIVVIEQRPPFSRLL